MIPIPQGVAAFVARASLSGIALAIMGGLLAVQTVRIEGLSIWPVSVTGWKSRAVAAETALAAAKAAYARQSARQADIAADYERGASNARQKAETRQAAVRTIFRNVEVSVDCAAPDAVRGLLSEAVADANAAAGH